MSKIKTASRPVYTASDGLEFSNKAEAEAYQAGIDAAPMIEAYIGSEHSESKERHRNTLHKLLVSWEGFKATNETAKDNAVPVTTEA